MPELPELEITKERLRLALVGRLVSGTVVRSPSALKTCIPPLEVLTGHHILSVNRLGKVIVLRFDNRLFLCIPLMLSGRFALGPTSARLNRLHAFALHLDRDEDLRIIEGTTRHRLSMYLAPAPQQVDIIARLGPDPLSPEFTLARLRQLLARRPRTLKRLLTDQSAIAGIGNCFSDEILFEAKLSPFSRSTALKPDETIRLFAAAKQVLREAVLHLRALHRLPARRDCTFLRVHGRLNQTCPVCSKPVRRVNYRESALFYCSTCQTGGRELADRRYSKFLK